MELSYTIKRSSRRKRIRITVERDRSVVIHAPTDVPEEEIREIVEKKKHWIFEKTGHKRKYRSPGDQPGKEIVSGESAFYLGREYRIEIVDDSSSSVKLDQVFSIPSAFVRKGREVLRDWYFHEAEHKILPRVDFYGKELGLIFKSSKIVDNRFRWGSCTPKKNLTFNWRLIKAPMFVIDYVIIHELAHLLEANHTDRFWSIVRAHHPKSEEARNWLKENGELLEQEI